MKQGERANPIVDMGAFLTYYKAMRSLLSCAFVLAGTLVWAGPASETSLTMGGKSLAIKYGAKGAPAAFHTDTELVFKGLVVPKGDYTVWVMMDSSPWQLVVSKQTEAGAVHNPKLDLGRVPLTISAAAAAGVFKMTLSQVDATTGKLELAAEKNVATATFLIDLVDADKEW